MIRQVLAELHGVDAFGISVIDKQVQIDHQPGRVSGTELVETIRGLGLEAHFQGEQVLQSWWDRWGQWTSLIVGAAMLLGAALPGQLSVWVLGGAILIAGSGFFAQAWNALRHRRLDMNVLMTIAVIGAALLGEWVEAAAVAVLFNLAELIESYTLDRARRAISSLMQLVPARASVQRDGEWTDCPVEGVRPGELMQIRPGEQIPLDGTVSSGSSHVNQAPITGESKPTSKQPEDEVFAGTLNQTGYLEVVVTRPFRDTTLARIIHRIEQAQAEKAPSERFVDKFARIYTPLVILGALLVAVGPPLLVSGALWSVWVYRALVLLVISCPCALVISTPVSIISALTSAARHGILIKGGVHLEALGNLRAVALDKTGTVTLGRTEVVEVCPAEGVTRETVLRNAASVEHGSEHPLGRAIRACAQTEALQVPESTGFAAITGQGVEATVDGRRVVVGNRRLIEARVASTTPLACPHEGAPNTAVGVARDAEFLGTIHIGDVLRPGAKRAIHYLKESGVEQTVLLTGDNRPTAQVVADSLGVDSWQSELLPEDKVAAVKALAETYGTVAMVGDGVNDAPALAAASVGIAMGTAGSDTALETADVALMSDDLGKLSFAIRLGQRARGVIGQNIVLAIGIKLVFLSLACAGLATLWMAIAADLGASLLVIFNGLRLLGGVAEEPCDHVVEDPAALPVLATV